MMVPMVVDTLSLVAKNLTGLYIERARNPEIINITKTFLYYIKVDTKDEN